MILAYTDKVGPFLNLNEVLNHVHFKKCSTIFFTKLYKRSLTNSLRFSIELGWAVDQYRILRRLMCTKFRSSQRIIFFLQTSKNKNKKQNKKRNGKNAEIRKRIYVQTIRIKLTSHGKLWLVGFYLILQQWFCDKIL